MLSRKLVKRLVACNGSIQLVTALSVLSYREKEQQELNCQYENYLVITPLWAPQGQADEFAAFIEKIARSVCPWKKIVYIPLEQIGKLANILSTFNLSSTSQQIHELLEVESPDEIYLARNWKFENQLLMNVYESAEKICYGDGIGIHLSQSAFLLPRSPKSSMGYLEIAYKYLKKNIQVVLFQKKKYRYKNIETLLEEKEFDLGYFSLPAAFGELPLMRTVVLDKNIYLEIFEKLRKKLGSLTNTDFINRVRLDIQAAPTSILLTSNFSEAAGRMSLEDEVTAYREFLEAQEVPKNSVLLIKPHPRDSKLKALKLKSALSDLYSDIFLLVDEILFYLPFEVFFMEVFLNPHLPKLQIPKIFTFSSACLTLEFLFNAECIVGFGSDIIKKFFYEEHIASRIKHEADLLSTILEIRRLNASDPSKNSST